MYRFITIPVIILSLVLNGINSCAQQFNFDYYNKGNGLISNEVDCIRQNKDGYMLFGTPSGLGIFDASTFSNYDIQKGFRHNIVSDIIELPGSELLLLTNSNQFYRYRNKKLLPDSFPTNDGIKHLYQTKQGEWIASGYKGVYKWNNRTLDRLNISPVNSYPGINCVVQWQDSLLVVGRSYESVDVYNMHTWQLVASSAEKIFVRNFFTDASGNLWIATIGNGMRMMNAASVNNRQIQFASLPHDFDAFASTEFRAITQDKEGNIWMAGINNGLVKYNAQSGSFVHFTMDQGLASNTLFSLYCDREDNIWIGSNRGIQKLVHKNVFSYSARQGLPADLVLDILPVKDNGVMICGYSGMGFIKSNDATAIAWKPPLDDEYVFRLVSSAGKYYGLSLRELLDITGGGKGISLNRIYDLPEHTRGMVAIAPGKLILGGDSSITLFDNGKISLLTREAVHYISCMTMDANGFLWTGNLNNTINCYRIGNGTGDLPVTLMSKYPVHSSGPQGYIQCMVPGKGNTIIYGTSRDGIFIIEKDKEKIIEKAAITISSGLGSNHVTFLSWFNDSTLMAGTGDGLDKIIFRPAADTFIVRNINRYYNISNSVYNAKPDAAGNILLATESGFYKIPSVDIEHDISRELPIVITGVQLLSSPDSVISPVQPLRLAYNNSSISISFSSPSFTNEKNTRYTYLLKGKSDNQWSTASASGTVTYSDLPPGHYEFMVKPVNMYGNVGASAARIDIEVVPAFWQTWWFYSLLALILAITIFFIIRRRIQFIRRESVLKTKIAETEMMALRTQMNPHFIFNCMNMIDGLISGNRNREAQDFLQKFSKLIRLVLENSQYQLVPLQQDLQALKLYTELEAIRFNHHFRYEFDVNEELLEDNYKIPPLLLQPYVENAIVHGLRNREKAGGYLKVVIQKEGDGIEAIIEDNGIGRKQAALLNISNEKPHQQIGMKVTGKRIELLRQVNPGTLDITVGDLDKTAESGTRVVITLPGNIHFE